MHCALPTCRVTGIRDNFASVYFVHFIDILDANKLSHAVKLGALTTLITIPFSFGVCEWGLELYFEIKVSISKKHTTMKKWGFNFSKKKNTQSTLGLGS